MKCVAHISVRAYVSSAIAAIDALLAILELGRLFGDCNLTYPTLSGLGNLNLLRVRATVFVRQYWLQTKLILAYIQGMIAARNGRVDGAMVKSDIT